MREDWEWLRFALAVLLGVAAITTIVVLVTREPSPPEPSQESGGPAAATAPTGLAPVAIKIDNVGAARPQTGLGAADVVYVEPVEGGFTRLVAVYDGDVPDIVGPVRSARLTDIELLAQYGNPVLAYSGAAPESVPALRASTLVNTTPDDAPGAFFREPARPAPHNLFARTDRLPAPGPGPAEPALRYGDAPEGGTAVPEHRAAFGNAAFAFRWAPETGRWQVSMDGAPVVSTESGPVTAATVVVQRVAAPLGESPEDPAGNSAPVARTVGEGQAALLRDGKRFDVTWSRTAPQAPTLFRDTTGTPVPLAAGPVWVLLVPA